ncbi:MAG: hypothetical protein IPO07_16770 [Haliscomenobacter sp.]|nr:GEVED domain-containing protein [Haliscomenobacter sp.]MBK9490236.1 hypothetical protein [Haliscomenobacter sp.]
MKWIKPQALMDGEVEDYLVRVKGLDYGDLADTQPGVSTGDYQTLEANNGPRHAVAETPAIYLGASVDVDVDGQPDLGAGEDGTNGDDNDTDGDDENGVTKPVMIFQGETAVFEVNVTTNCIQLVYGYIDWNNDGKFDGLGEIQSATTIPVNRSVTLTFPVPLNAVAGVPLGARFRVGSVDAQVNTPLGFAMDGEVEDYLVAVKALDYGDLPAPYLTTEVQDGPRHAVAPTPELYLGTVVDIDPDGQPDADAGETDGGDDGDSTGGDDEDGVIEPAMIFRGETAAFQVAVVNKTANTAYVYGYVDWNDNGVFDAGNGEIQFSTVAANTSATVTLTFNVPLGASAVINNDLGARFRVGTVQDEVDQATGFAMNGEVEDYLVRVKGLDFGDLPTPPYATQDGVDGPRHGVSEDPKVYLGTKPDVELDGQPDPNAGETGNGDGADENGVVEPAMLFQGEEAKFTVNVVTNTTAYLYGYIDWNKDGEFGWEWRSAVSDGCGDWRSSADLQCTTWCDDQH